MAKNHRTNTKRNNCTITQIQLWPTENQKAVEAPVGVPADVQKDKNVSQVTQFHAAAYAFNKNRSWQEMTSSRKSKPLK